VECGAYVLRDFARDNPAEKINSTDIIEMIIAVIRKSSVNNSMPYHGVINKAINAVAQVASIISPLASAVNTAKNSVTSQNSRKNFITA
jgi:hypothetical protein